MWYLVLFFLVLILVVPVTIIAIVLAVMQSREKSRLQQEMETYKKAHVFCRNCGKPLNPRVNICVSCGAKSGTGNKFCFRCGKRTDPIAVVCVSCGVSLADPYQDPASRKSGIAAGLFALFLGLFGVHNFYLGHTAKAIIQLFITLVALMIPFLIAGIAIVGIWAFVEGIMILAGGISKDARGVPLK